MEPRLSLLTFPQRIDDGTLHLRILIVPRLSAAWNGNPLQPLIAGFPNPGDTTPAFADADLRLELRVLSGLDRFPVQAPVDVTAPLPAASGVRPNARTLFEELIAPGRFTLSAGAPELADPVAPAIFIKKYLPQSYRSAFLFTGPRTPDAVTDDSYHCAIRASTEPNEAFVVSPDTVSWGEIYAFCLRHAPLATELGLIRSASVAVDAALFETGGFVYADFADGGAYAAQAAADFTFLKRYAARIPPLEEAAARPLFAAVLFPVLFDDPLIPGPPPAPGNFDAVFIEAATYDDGFARIVHGMQPVSQNLLAEEPDGFSPLTDIGIRLAWDDEQILIWQNRQLKEDPTVPPVPGEPQRLDVPLGVFGYRIDAREHGDGDWHSLVRVRSRAPLALGATPLGPPGQLFEGELGVEVHPMQIDGNQATGQFWLPAYLSQWSGTSLVLPDEDAAAIFKTEEADDAAASLGRMYDAVGLADIPLRYGRTYDFRVRLMDPTAGGPETGDQPVHESAAPIATVPFRRRVVPEPVRIAGLARVPDVAIDTLFPGDALQVSRPPLGYPSVVFTGKYADPVALLEAAAGAAIGADSFGLPDPDAMRVRIDVEVRTLSMDNLLSLSGRESYILLYTTERAFPEDPQQPRTVPLEFRDAAVLTFGDPNTFGDLDLTQAEIDALDELVLPAGRDVRLTVRAVADADPAYFAPGAHLGKALQVHVRREPADERELLAATSEVQRIRGIYLQPDSPPPFDGTFKQLLIERAASGGPAIVQRLAEQIGLDHKGLTLVGRPGERIVFGCSRRIRHTLAPDHSSLTFAAREDLINQWLVALTLEIERDWTWDGLQPIGFEIFRTRRFEADAETDDNGGRPIGDWEVVRTASLLALQKPQRSRTTLIFLDAVDPKSALTQEAHPAETRFPDTIVLDYRIETRFRSAPAEVDPAAELHLVLPVTTPPAQVPRIAAAGLALSKYERDETYSQTQPRRRFLWLELEQPVQDPNDTLFARVLAFAPDPLLSDNRLETYVPPEEPPLPIDPEPIRVISPGQTDDRAGLGAMMPLEAAGNSDRHFLMPLPPGLHADSPELFGFFTYELRIGHAAIWSTAQGRFGRPLRATGVQHPAPTLFCTCHRNEQEITVDAPFAVAVLNGKQITAQPPRTEIWALIYAQVRQADGRDYRNILLDDRQLRLLPLAGGRTVDAQGQIVTPFQNRDATPRGTTRWTQAEISGMLRDMGLPQDSPLSVLCVEVMPGLAALRVHPSGPGIVGTTDLAGAVRLERAGSAPVGAPPPAAGGRPLSDDLGSRRIVRSSPLTAVPAICCQTC